MAVITCKHPFVKMDLMVPKKIWPQVVSLALCCGCSYAEEKEVLGKSKNDLESWVLLRDISSEQWCQFDKLINSINNLHDVKIYILLSPRKRGNTHVQKDRKETGSRRNGRNTRKSAGDIRFGPNSRSGDSPVESGDHGCDDLGELSVLQESSNDDCE